MNVLSSGGEVFLKNRINEINLKCQSKALEEYSSRAFFVILTFMIEPELKKHLENIEGELKGIKHKIGSTGSVLWRGIVSGAGYVVGAALILVVIGWILNIVGVIPAFQKYANDFRQVLDNAGRAVR